MPKYEVTLRVTIEAKPVVIQALNQEDLRDKVENIDLMELLQKHSYGLEVVFSMPPKRVFDSVPVTFGKEEAREEKQLPEAKPEKHRTEFDMCDACEMPRGVHASMSHEFVEEK